MSIRLNYRFCLGILYSCGFLFVSNVLAVNNDDSEKVAPTATKPPKFVATNPSASSIESFLSKYIVGSLENNFDKTNEKYSESFERSVLIDLIKLNDANYNSSVKTTDAMESDFREMCAKNGLSAIGLIGTKISPEVLFSLESIAKKCFKNNAKVLMVLGAILKLCAVEIALTVKEAARSQQCVDIANKFVCSCTLDELVQKISNIGGRLISLAKNGEKDRNGVIRINDFSICINRLMTRYLVNGGAKKQNKRGDSTSTRVIRQKFFDYKDLLNKHKEYIDALKNADFLNAQIKEYSKRDKEIISYDGLISAKDSELQRKPYAKVYKNAVYAHWVKDYTIDELISYLMNYSFISKDDSEIVSQIFNMVINTSITLKDKVEFLECKDDKYRIDDLCKEHFGRSLSLIQLKNESRYNMLKDFINKHIAPNALNLLVESVTGNKSKPGIFTQEFSNAIRSEVRIEALKKVYSKISLDMIIGLNEIFKKYFDNQRLKRQDRDRMLAFGGVFSWVLADTAQSCAERIYNLDTELSKVFKDKESITTFIFDSLKEIMQTLQKNSSKSKHASFIKEIEKRILSKRTAYNVNRGQQYQEVSISDSISEIKKMLTKINGDDLEEFAYSTESDNNSEMFAFKDVNHLVPHFIPLDVNKFNSFVVTNPSVSSIESFLSKYIVGSLEIENNFDETYKKCSKSFERSGLISLIKLNDINYNSSIKTTDEMVSDFRKMCDENSLNAIGLIVAKISPEILFSLESIAEKCFKNDTKILVVLGAILRLCAVEIALTVKEVARSQQCVDIANKLVASCTLAQLVQKITGIGGKLISLAKNGEKDSDGVIRIDSFSMRIDSLITRYLVNRAANAHSFPIRRKINDGAKDLCELGANKKFIERKLFDYEALLDKHKEYIDALKNADFFKAQIKEYSKRDKEIISYDGLISAKDSELQREFYVKGNKNGYHKWLHYYTIDELISYLTNYSFISKDDSEIVSQIFNIAINHSIKLKDKVELLDSKYDKYRIDGLCKKNFENSLRLILFNNESKADILKDFINKHIVPNALNLLVESVTGNKSKPGIFTQEFSNAIRSEVRMEALKKVYSKISLDMIIGLNEILKNYFENPGIKMRNIDRDRMIVFGGLFAWVVADTARSCAERIHNDFDKRLSKVFENVSIPKVIFDSLKEIAQTLLKNSSKSKYASFIKEVDKRISLKYTAYNVNRDRPLYKKEVSISDSMSEIEKILAESNSATTAIKPQKSDVNQTSVSSTESFLSKYIVGSLENNFDKTNEKYSESFERLGLIDLIKLNDFNYNSSVKTTDEMASDFMQICAKNGLSAIGLIGTKISPKILFSLEPIAKKWFKNDTKILVVLGTILKLRAIELALTVKEAARSQQCVDIANKFVCSCPLDELVQKISNIGGRLLSIAEENEKNTEVLKRISSIRKDLENMVNGIRWRNNRFITDSGLHWDESKIQYTEIVNQRLSDYRNLLNTHKKYTDDLKDEKFLKDQIKKYSKPGKGVVDYDGVIAAKDSELQREFHKNTRYSNTSTAGLISSLKNYSFISKDDSEIVSQMFDMAINSSIKLKDKVDLLGYKEGSRLIDGLCKKNFENSLTLIQLSNKSKPDILKDFINKHIAPNGLNLLVESVTGNKSKPGIFTQEFSNAIRSEVRVEALRNVYSKISLDMIIGLNEIFKNYFDNQKFKKQDRDRMIAFGGLLALLIADTAQSCAERIYNLETDLSKLFEDKDSITTFIFDSLKEIMQTLQKNSSKSKYASFIKEIEKRILSKRTAYYSKLSLGQQYQDASIADSILEIEKIKGIKKALGGNLKNKIKNIFSSDKLSTKQKKIWQKHVVDAGGNKK